MTPRLAPVATGAFGGALYALSLPKADLGWLAWLCLVPPLVVSARSGPVAQAPRRLAVAGFAFGLTSGLGRVYWVAETLRLYGGLDWLPAVLTMCLLTAYLALYPAIFFSLVPWLATVGAAFPWLAASAWALLDWVQTWMISGFPWSLLGYTQYRLPALAQVAAFTGVHGITYLIVLANAALAGAVAGLAPRVRLLAPVGAAITAALALGSQRLDKLNAEAIEASVLRVGIVQGNVRQDRKWDRSETDTVTLRYAELSRLLVRDHGRQDLVVWPETALPYRLDADAYRALRQRVTDLAVELDTPLLVGSLGSRDASGRPGTYNRSYLIGRDGAVVGMADKVHLVPFGEYLPVPWLFGYLDELTAQSGAFDAGAAHHTLTLPAPERAALGVFICYESAFPSIPRALTAVGASFLVNTTNDAWFGTTAAPRQHFAMAVMRAIETGRPVVRAANTGISGSIEPTGRVASASSLFTTEILGLEVAPRSERTFYVRHGDIVFAASALLLLAAAVAGSARRSRRIRSEIARAVADLQDLAATPVPLSRPVLLLPGYDSEASRWALLQGWLERCCTNAHNAVIAVDLRRDMSIAELAALVAELAPAGPVDVVGHSLGALVGIQLQLQADRVRYVCALSAPLDGTPLAALARRVRYPYPRTLSDLSRASPGLACLRQRLSQLRGVRSLALAGDPIASGAPAAIHHSYDVPLLVGPGRRHRAAPDDPRIIRDILTALRGSGASRG